MDTEQPSELTPLLDDMDTRVAALIKERDALREALERIRDGDRYLSDGTCVTCEEQQSDHAEDCPVYIATAALALRGQS